MPLRLGLAVVTLWVWALASSSPGNSLRFYGKGIPEKGRVKIALAPKMPVNVGATDFTIEFWMKAAPGSNNSSAYGTGNDAWIYGNIIFDRDVYGPGRFGDYGIAIGRNRILFGVNNGRDGATVAGSRKVTDGLWHHIAVTRRYSTGQLSVFVDGRLDGRVAGPLGNIRYDDRYAGSPNDAYLVIGAEKHDLDTTGEYSYNGFLTDIRFSRVVRYTKNFTRPRARFKTDSKTVALYPMNEMEGNIVYDTSKAAHGPSDGVRFKGGSGIGPFWKGDGPPFGSSRRSIEPMPGEAESESSSAAEDWTLYR